MSPKVGLAVLTRKLSILHPYFRWIWTMHKTKTQDKGTEQVLIYIHTEQYLQESVLILNYVSWWIWKMRHRNTKQMRHRNTIQTTRKLSLSLTLPLSCRSFSTKEPLNIGRFCQKWPVKNFSCLGHCWPHIVVFWKHVFWQHDNMRRMTVCSSVTRQYVVNTTSCNLLQHTATYCNILQHTATHHNTTQHNTTQHNTTQPQRNILQHTATYCNTLPHTTTHCHICGQHTCGMRSIHDNVWWKTRQHVVNDIV